MEKPLDKFFADMEKNKAFASVHLDKQAVIVERIDKQISDLEFKIKHLETQKQAALADMREYMELAVVNTYERSNGYTITHDNKMKMKIRNVAEFLRWMKTHVEPLEVMRFFEDALKAANVKKFVEKQCDIQRGNGELNPKVDGIDLDDITFRRLTTLYKGKEK